MQSTSPRGEASTHVLNGSTDRAPGNITGSLLMISDFVVVQTQPDLCKGLDDLQILHDFPCRATQGDIIQIYHVKLCRQKGAVAVD